MQQRPRDERHPRRDHERERDQQREAAHAHQPRLAPTACAEVLGDEDARPRRHHQVQQLNEEPELRDQAHRRDGLARVVTQHHGVDAHQRHPQQVLDQYRPRELENRNARTVGTHRGLNRTSPFAPRGDSQNSSG